MSDLEFMETYQEDVGTAMEEVMRLVDALITAQGRVEDAEAELSERKAFERRLREQIIPQYMAQHRLSELVLENGKTVTVSDELAVSVPKDEEKRKKVIAFLTNNEGGELIKEQVSFEDADEEILSQLVAKGITFDRSLSINAASLKAWFRRALGLTKNTLARLEPKNVPEEFNLYLYKNTKIKG